jgi:hypothetical protein
MRLALVATVVFALAGTATGAVTTSPRDRLTITVWPQGRGVGNPVSSARLNCHPPGGTHPRPARACRRLFAHLDALKPVPPTSICLGIYGGPRVAYVRGQVAGRRVRAWLNRKNSCEIKRWDALGILLRL